ncbi:hypothetical protein QR680_010016 [Steinernema hermaphroditum]|uniref:Uncharacterized protein n=1 Tax=Steinernema hermaphroditum TaxID=289476 RepID=A0AA39IMF8_9BILA|nr:hypothetical protein QR680_010016 [Steinernema hermaphroditum]
MFFILSYRTANVGRTSSFPPFNAFSRIRNRSVKPDIQQAPKFPVGNRVSRTRNREGTLPGVTYDVPYPAMFVQVRAALEVLKKRQVERERIIEEAARFTPKTNSSVGELSQVSALERSLFRLDGNTPLKSVVEQPEVVDEVHMMQTPKRFATGAAQHRRSMIPMSQSFARSGRF